MNRQLASAVLATFCESERSEHRRRLASFPLRSWRKNFHWLDASGLALYFLRELKARRMEDALSESILVELERRYQENIGRTQVLFEEFARINVAFRAAQLRYVNLKGFTLTPDCCPDLSLRYQTDFDFLMSRSDAEKCRGLLTQLGYGIVAANDRVLEFKTDIGATPHIQDLYKARPERTVEIHLCDARRADRDPALLDRSRQVSLHGNSYPALSREDTFLTQAWHLFRHLRSEWTRISWLLELRHFVLRHRDNSILWNVVERSAGPSSDGARAIGFVLQFAEAVLGPFAPHELARWSLPQVPPEAALWVQRYANRVAQTDFPGSKLYLILEHALSVTGPKPSIRHRLFPTRAPAPVVVAPTTGLLRRTRAFASRIAYFQFRLRFHLLATSQYFIERWLWSRDRRHPLLQSGHTVGQHRQLSEVHD